MASSLIRLALFLLLHHALLSAVRSSDTDALRVLIAVLGGGLSDAPGAVHRPLNPCRVAGVACEWQNGAVRAVRVALPSRGLDGSIPPVIGNLSALRELSLPGNLLSGGIPPEIAGCRELRVLDLSGNALSGRVPQEISSLTRLRSLDLSGNQIRGDLGFLTAFPNLENLSLADNLFTGRVPPSLSSFRNLRLLDLSGNPGLRGPLPNLPSAVEVSPLGQSDDGGGNLLPKRYVFAEDSPVRRNSSTPFAGRPLGRGRSAPAPAPTPAASPAADHGHHRRKVVTWIVGFAVGALVGIASGMVFSVLLRFLLNCIRGRYRRRGGPAIFSSLVKAKQLAFLEKEDGLASLEVIGRGGCGVVYKATLVPAGTGNAAAAAPGKIVAIKKITKLQLDASASELSEEESRLLDKRMRQLRSEINTVGHVRHRNLLPLLAHVALHDYHLLVYEYMKNGSLQDALKGDGDGRRELDWPVLLRIAVGIASGLEYLHMQHSPRIIHRDLKPANILLDDNMEARISDFGLAKSVPDQHTHVTTSNVVGTLGYISPEYHQTLKFTDKCDIYSFGVILAVMVMGKAPSDEFFQSTDEMNLVKWLRNVMRAGRPEEAMDERLRGKGHEEQMTLVLKVACLCTVDDPKQRPNSKDVRCMLTQINKNRTP